MINFRIISFQQLGIILHGEMLYQRIKKHTYALGKVVYIPSAVFGLSVSLGPPASVTTSTFFLKRWCRIKFSCIDFHQAPAKSETYSVTSSQNQSMGHSPQYYLALRTLREQIRAYVCWLLKLFHFQQSCSELVRGKTWDVRYFLISDFFNGKKVH